MPPADILLTFFITTALFAYIPGPAMLYAAAQTMAGGRRAGLLATLGIHAGGYVHVATAAAGLAILFEAVPTLYLAVKFGGAAYLIWLGVCLFRSKADNTAITVEYAAKSARRAFFQSVMVEMLNPKTALFFMAFLPQFIDPAATLPVWLQFVILGTLVNLIFTTADIVCVFFAGVLLTRLRRSSSVQRMVQRAGGAVLVGLGAHLAFQKS